MNIFYSTGKIHIYRSFQSTFYKYNIIRNKYIYICVYNYLFIYFPYHLIHFLFRSRVFQLTKNLLQILYRKILFNTILFFLVLVLITWQFFLVTMSYIILFVVFASSVAKPFKNFRQSSILDWRYLLLHYLLLYR